MREIFCPYHVPFSMFDVFTNFTTSSPFWATLLDFYEMFLIGKVGERDQRNILVKYFLWCVLLWTYDVLLVSNCSISLNLPIHRHLELLKIIFTKCFLWLKLFRMISKTFWTIIFIPSLVFYLWRHFAVFLYFTTSSLFSGT